MAAAGMGLPLIGMSRSARGETGHVNRPNLLIIQTDEHNFRTLGCYRETLSSEQAFMWGKDSFVETPHIDWLAHNGALATKFYAATPVCSPSRASFVSGLYPQNTDVVNNNIPMSGNVVTFAEILRRAGYATGYVGKWHLDGDGKPQWEPDRSFGFEDNRYMFNRGHWKQFEDTAEGPRVKAREEDKPSYSVKGADKKSFTTDWLTDKTIDFIREHRSSPFCCMLSIPDPHGPDTVRAPYNGMYDRMEFAKPRTYSKPQEGVPMWAKGQPKCNTDQAQYFGMVKCIDDNVGKIMEVLRETGLIDNTIVVFTADHGDLRAEHHRQDKGVPMEASIKVPLVVYYPKRIKAGTIVEQALGTADFLPTILVLTGVPTTGKEEGRDASALFTGGVAPGKLKDITFVRSTSGHKSQWIGVFTSRYKLIVSLTDEPWLIDMEEDPDELRNFCAHPQHRDTVRTLAHELLDYGKRYRDPRLSLPKIATDLEQLTGAWPEPSRNHVVRRRLPCRVRAALPRL